MPINIIAVLVTYIICVAITSYTFIKVGSDVIKRNRNEVILICILPVVNTVCAMLFSGLYVATVIVKFIKKFKNNKR